MDFPTIINIFIFQVQPRKFDCGLFDDDGVLTNFCCDRTGQKGAQKEVESDESDLVTPERGTVIVPEPEPALDVRNTFVAEVTYKQVVFSSGVPCGEGARGEGEKEWGGIERGSGGKQGKGGEGGGQGQ